MGINFNNGWILLLCIPALAFVLWSFCKTQRMGSKKEKWVTGLRCLIVILLILSLAGTSIQKYTDSTTVIFAVDLSSSTRDVRQDMVSFIESALQKKSHKYQTGIVTFGKEPLVEQPVSRDMLFSNLETVPKPHFTSIDAGLQMAGALMPGGTRKKIVLLTDGNENIDDGVERARALARQGIKIDGVFFDTRPEQEVQVTSLDLPASLYQGETYDIHVTIDSTINTSGTLRLFANRQLISEQEVEIQKGKNSFVFKDTAKEGGIKTYEVDLQVDKDKIIQNNQMASFVNIKGHPIVALVEGREGEGRELTKIMEAGGIGVKIFTPLTLPPDLKELRKYHGIVLCNVSADDLKEEKIKILDSYVKSMGRGLLVTGGDNSYALGGYMGTLLEKMLPVDLDLSQKADIPSLGLVLVIDKSGSMAMGEYGITKMDMAKEAAIRSIEALRSTDYIGVVAFDGAATWVVETQHPQDLKKIEGDILSIPPTGGTNIYPGLQMAYDSLTSINPKLKHVILLTDGQSQAGDFEGIVGDMDEAGITLSCVAVGSDSDRALLENLAKLGKGRYYYTDEFSDIPKIFTKETYLATQSYIQNRVFFPTVTGYSPIISGFTEGFPNLKGYVATMPKNSATMVLASDKMDPVLAEWQYGLGRVVAWTSDARGGWTENWLAWERGQEFWLNAISRILPADQQSEGIIETSRIGDKGQVTVILGENLDQTLETRAVIVDPEGMEKEVDLQVTEPGKYQGEFDIGMPGVYLIRVEQQNMGKTVNTLDSGLAVTYSPEYDIRQESSQTFLERIVSKAGGSILDNPNQVFVDDLEPVWAQTEIWPWLLQLAIILFALDIAVRRLRIEAVLVNWRKSRALENKTVTKSRAKVGKGVVSKDEYRDMHIQTAEEKQDTTPDREQSGFSSKLLDARKGSKRRKL